MVQAVLLYGAELMEKALQSFHQKCARYISGQHIQPDTIDIEGKMWISVLQAQMYCKK
jgi:predicted HTH transcriptional regulator